LKYSVVGLGKLGSCMAAVIASRGFHVVGMDINRAAVQALQSGLPPIWETGLAEIISANKERLSASNDLDAVITETDVTFVVVPTPSQSDGAFSLKYVSEAFASIGAALGKKDAYHLIVLVSTVLPGDTRSKLIPKLEDASNKSCGQDFGVCFNPAFIALGSIVEDFLKPDFVLIGESDPRAGDVLSECYREMGLDKVPFARMSIENAELSKLAVNTFVTTKISFANMLGEMCGKLPGGDVDVVTGALGLDSRIGRKYLRAGAAYGGPCFPRDNEAFRFWADKIGVANDLARATDKANREFTARLLDTHTEVIAAASKVAILGLAYKLVSNWAEEGQGILLAQSLSAQGKQVNAHDFLASEMSGMLLKDTGVVLCEDPAEALEGADLVFLTLPGEGYRKALCEAFEKTKHTVYVFDLWRSYGEIVTQYDHVKLISFGRASS